jgi:hypothetical protein
MMDKMSIWQKSNTKTFFSLSLLLWHQSVVKHVIKGTNVAAPEKLKNLKRTQFDDSLFVLLICIAKSTQVYIFTNGPF